MDKGLLIIAAIGIAIIYYATNFAGEKPAEGKTSWSIEGKKHRYDPYYEKDVLGDQVLNLNTLTREKAKAIWKITPTAKRIAKAIPDFDLAIAEARNKVVKGTFKQYLLAYMENLKSRYLAGEINDEQAQKLLIELR